MHGQVRLVASVAVRIGKRAMAAADARIDEKAWYGGRSGQRPMRRGTRDKARWDQENGQRPMKRRTRDKARCG